MIRVIKNLIKNIVFIFIKPKVTVAFNSFSHDGGEDLIIKTLFNEVGISKPAYLDIGASDPTEVNNTFLFYQNGSRGVLVEANELLIPNIKLYRPEDKTLNCGVGVTTTNEEIDFYVFEQKGLSTFDKEEAERRNSSGTYKMIKISKVKLLNINTIISENFDTYPELLSIDIEGWDLQVLKTLDFTKYPIPVICAETCIYTETHIKPKNLAFLEFMSSVGYFIYADTYFNSIFVNSIWFNSLERQKK